MAIAEPVINLPIRNRTEKSRHAQTQEQQDMEKLRRGGGGGDGGSNTPHRYKHRPKTEGKQNEEKPTTATTAITKIQRACILNKVEELEI